MSKNKESEEQNCVYQTQFTPHLDTRAALEYGDEIKVLCENRGEPSIAPTRLVNDLKYKLKYYTELDYILPAGSPAVIAAAVCIAAKKTGGKVSLLLWDKNNKRYYPVDLDLK